MRVSVGATPRDLGVEVLRGSAGLLLPGLFAGTLLAAGAATLLRVAVLGVNVLNPLTYVAVAIVECGRSSAQRAIGVGPFLGDAQEHVVSGLPSGSDRQRTPRMNAS